MFISRNHPDTTPMSSEDREKAEQLFSETSALVTKTRESVAQGEINSDQILSEVGRIGVNYFHLEMTLGISYEEKDYQALRTLGDGFEELILEK